MLIKLINIGVPINITMVIPSQPHVVITIAVLCESSKIGKGSNWVIELVPGWFELKGIGGLWVKCNVWDVNRDWWGWLLGWERCGGLWGLGGGGGSGG